MLLVLDDAVPAVLITVPVVLSSRGACDEVGDGETLPLSLVLLVSVMIMVGVNGVVSSSTTRRCPARLTDDDDADDADVDVDDDNDVDVDGDGCIADFVQQPPINTNTTRQHARQWWTTTTNTRRHTGQSLSRCNVLEQRKFELLAVILSILLFVRCACFCFLCRDENVQQQLQRLRLNWSLQLSLRPEKPRASKWKRK